MSDQAPIGNVQSFTKTRTAARARTLSKTCLSGRRAPDAHVGGRDPETSPALNGLGLSTEAALNKLVFDR